MTASISLLRVEQAGFNAWCSYVINTKRWLVRTHIVSPNLSGMALCSFRPRVGWETTVQNGDGSADCPRCIERFERWEAGG